MVLVNSDEMSLSQDSIDTIEELFTYLPVLFFICCCIVIALIISLFNYDYAIEFIILSVQWVIIWPVIKYLLTYSYRCIKYTKVLNRSNELLNNNHYFKIIFTEVISCLNIFLFFVIYSHLLIHIIMCLILFILIHQFFRFIIKKKRL